MMYFAQLLTCLIGALTAQVQDGHISLAPMNFLQDRIDIAYRTGWSDMVDASQRRGGRVYAGRIWDSDEYSVSESWSGCAGLGCVYGLCHRRDLTVLKVFSRWRCRPAVRRCPAAERTHWFPREVCVVTSTPWLSGPLALSSDVCRLRWGRPPSLRGLLLGPESWRSEQGHSTHQSV